MTTFVAPTVDDFQRRFPEFAGTDPALIQQQLDDAQIWIDGDLWNSQAEYRLAVLYWTAHYLYLSQWQGVNGGASFTSQSGPSEADLFVRMIRMGDRSVAYGERNKGGANAGAMNSPGEGLLNITLYGQLYIQLRTRNIIPIAIM